MKVETPAGMIDDVTRAAAPLTKLVGHRFKRAGRFLFTFRRKTRTPLDMAFVPVPLDVAFLDGVGRVLETQRMRPWTINPATWTLYRPDDPYTYALEVEAGLLAAHDVEPGARLRFHD